MDDMNAMVQAGKEVVDLCDKSLSLLDKFHFLPLFGFRKKICSTGNLCNWKWKKNARRI